MAETLAGTIDQMSLLEILKLLNSGKMSGRLKVSNSFGNGELYVKAGRIIHCVAGAFIGETAITNMLSWIEGKFSFETGIAAPEESIKCSTEQLLLDNARKIEDWQSIKKVVSSMEIVFTLSTKSTTGTLKLQPEEWQILTLVNGNRTVADIVKLTDKDEFTIARILFNLESIGLLEKTDKPKKAVSAIINDDFFREIETELAKVIGPWASITVDESIKALGENRNAFPLDKIAAIVKKVTNEIDEEDEKLKFSQIMIDALKKY